jgi:hypothetical protein
MAQRDKSQGFGFVYVDVEQLMAQRDRVGKDRPLVTPTDVASVNFNKDPKKPQTEEVVAPIAVPKEKAQAMGQIRENLDRLQTLHHKLHAILEELSQVADRTPKKKR